MHIGNWSHRGGRGHHCGPGGRGRRQWGPLSVEWSFGPEERGGGGRGRRRMFDGGELRLLLLKLIDEQPRHGYDLIRKIEERSGGAYAPSPGVIYPTLTMLDDMTLIEEQKAEGARKQFGITEAGRAHLAERQAEVEALLARLAEIAGAQASASGGPVRRAMRNLRVVLQERLSGTEVDAETLHEMAAILDDAARRIERL
jgi:DNA-binding PadR family transcriptional regulator